MSVFNFETRTADLQNRYAQDNAAQEFGRFLSQQRFGRERRDMNDRFTQAFPRRTGQWARRLGSDVRSGLMTQDVTDFSNRYAQQLADVDTQQASTEAQFQGDMAARQAAYQRSLMALQEELARSRASQNPFAMYGGN
jgi:hypothetical protein